MVSRCTSTNASGQPCAAHVRPGEAWCRWHDPARADERQAWRRKGGKGKATSARLRKLWEGEQLSPNEVGGLLSAAMVAVYDGELEPGVVSALAAGARAMMAVREAGELEARLAFMEQVLDSERKRAG